MYFKTERLIARRLELKDLNEFDEMQSNIRVMKYTLGRENTRVENANELEKIINEYALSETNRTIMGISKSSDETCSLVGACAVIKRDVECFEVGYRLLEKYWGNGFGLEILEGLITYCLTDLGATELIAEVDKENIYSVRILEKSSMNFVKEYYEENNLVRMYMLNR
ncbi:GNAT family N-acetyltransferase [Bacillus sp. MRMR6]|uniref:GNAT family N-acetyltransferase n=1 Tax=Bacillus sp. MRMR6 TaxID=1928617 RepID=UPI00095164F7|nr:GNAT family N-acetyltransferase [Bacillus sp. MRMR6]OLS33559.1 hypothetical protein BTR25_25270 [Bacillus sp. MRMR6]